MESGRLSIRNLYANPHRTFFGQCRKTHACSPSAPAGQGHRRTPWKGKKAPGKKRLKHNRFLPLEIHIFFSSEKNVNRLRKSRDSQATHTPLIPKHI